VDDNQSERSGTVFNRVGTASQFSKGTDMIRVIEDEYDNEDNYLRKLNDPKEKGRPFSTTQKGAMNFNSKLAS
jgi:hypothetical protein